MSKLFITFYLLRDRKKIFRFEIGFMFPGLRDSPGSQESIGKKIFRKFEFFTVENRKFLIFVTIDEYMTEIKNFRFSTVKN